MNSPIIPLTIVAAIVVVGAFVSDKTGNRRILFYSVLIPAIIQISVAAWFILKSRGGGSFNGLGIIILSLLAVPVGLIANVLVNQRWKTESLLWATTRGIVVAAIAYAGAALVGLLLVIGL